MPASFPTSIKSFTTKTDGVDDIEASHINDLQLEVTAIETELFPIYGHMYQDDVPTTIVVAFVNTDYIVTGMSTGLVNGVTFQTARELKVLTAGKYEIHWSMSVRCATANQDMEGTVGLNGVRRAQSSGHFKLVAANDTGGCSGHDIVNLAVNNLITIVIRNETAANDLIVEHANLTIVRLRS